MKIKELSQKEYDKLCDRFNATKQIEAPNIDPIFKNMTVQGKSGKGTAFKNEYERMMEEWKNPLKPIQITVHDYNGSYIIRPKRKL